MDEVILVQSPSANKNMSNSFCQSYFKGLTPLDLWGKKLQFKYVLKSHMGWQSAQGRALYIQSSEAKLSTPSLFLLTTEEKSSRNSSVTGQTNYLLNSV